MLSVLMRGIDTASSQVCLRRQHRRLTVVLAEDGHGCSQDEAVGGFPPVHLGAGRKGSGGDCGVACRLCSAILAIAG